MATLIEVLRQRRDAAIRRAEQLAADTGRWGAHVTGVAGDAAAIDVALQDADHYAGQLDRLARHERSTTGPYSYRTHSFYRDLVLVDDDPEAARRLADYRARTAQWTTAESRDTGTSGFGALVPPGFALQAAGGPPRPGRALLDALLDSGAAAPLPPTGNTMSVPVATTAGMTAASQTAENTPAAESNPVYANVVAPVVTVMVRLDLSRQLFERGGRAFDEHLSGQVVAALDAEQERQLITGSGANGQMTGLLNAPGISLVSCDTADPVTVVAKTLQAARLGAEYRRTPTRVVAMIPTRHLWLGAATAGADHPSPVEVLERAMLAQVRTAAIPSVLGSGTNEDRILTLSGRDIAYAEDPLPRVRTASHSGASGLVQLIAWRYASLAVLYPSAVTAVTGPGLAQPAAF